MKLPKRIPEPMGASRYWYSGALIVLGGTLNLMAFVMLGSTGHDLVPPVLPVTQAPYEARVAVPAAPTLHDADPTNSGNHHHVRTATATPSTNPTLAYPSTGRLTAGHVAGGTHERSWAATLLEAIVTESPQPPAPAADPAPIAVPDMPPAAHIVVPAVGIDTAIVEVTPAKSEMDGRTLFTWAVADWAAGHHNTSANPGEGGNIVLSGHDDVRGEVFRGLHDIRIGDEVQLTSSAGAFTYVVTEIHVREYRKALVDELVAAGQFLAPMPEERLTLVTCWPYRIDTHRMIVVAMPIELPKGQG